MNFKYYIGRNSISGYHNLKTDKFIFKTVGVNPYIGIGGDFEGPFSNLKELSENSSFYQELLNTNSRTAAKLILPNNIQTLKQSILVPKGKSFDIDYYNFTQHALKPKFKNNEISGLHFLTENTRITKIYAINSERVIDVDLVIFDEDNQNWHKKRATIFPLDWNIGNLLAELEIAYLYRFPISKNKFAGFTASGVKVVFVYVNGKPKTAYPLI